MPRSDPSIDRLTRSHRNSFTAVRLDRLVEFRDDPEWLASALASPEARFLPQWRGRGLIDPVRSDRPVIYLAQRPANSPVTLLGRDSRYCYFACPVDDAGQRHLLETHPGAAFADLRLATASLHEKHAGILAYAKALLYWQYRHAFCGSCGAPNRLESAGHRLVCENPECARESFPRIDPAIIVLITQTDACLLGRNARWPERRFSTLAGYLEPGESLEDAVTREVFEEARVRLSAIRYVSSQPWPFPSSAMCGFYAEAASRDCAPTEEMEELRWLTAAELARAITTDEIRVPPPVSIAFRLIADWYRSQSGERLAHLVREAGSWAGRDRLE
ncbi:MAG: NAD(+) diphosphatase [Xanthomonadales bacterium]|nr:NAD(+) diphosphatase [Gammaproteobacteria bacterium]MBT8057356.1 NAD(+) diphosphatase [Gammaproteobacteria bacterium]NNJ80369.1 NAD(+) diphosphatase [Xanthomonadales bacterium]NNL04031.1 NAD(+) diphosphatase [Xanthomonadales bacterium]